MKQKILRIPAEYFVPYENEYEFFSPCRRAIQHLAMNRQVRQMIWLSPLFSDVRQNKNDSKGDTLLNYWIILNIFQIVPFPLEASDPCYVSQDLKILFQDIRKATRPQVQCTPELKILYE